MASADPPPLIRQMMRPDFYPHPARDVRLIQTHISFVLLAGPYAYKIKKPVNLGFLDFGTLERRHHFCNEELRLNRRGAPGMYLEVVALSETTPGVFKLGGDSSPVEFAVKMKRFPAEALLIDELRRGAIGEGSVLQLARRVVAFHGSAPLAPPGFGDANSVRASIDDNFHHTERFATPDGPQFPEQLDETRAFTDRFISSRNALLADRATTGRIRECHGDLHLGNICRSGDDDDCGFLLFDCIEFNEQFRFVDVMYDVGFTAMDLRANGREDLANAFINEYAERTGDWAGLRVLPLYLCRQAYVRAKVNSILWEQIDAQDDARTAAFGAAVSYYSLAREYARPRPARLLLMCGLSGSGKSTVARHIARRLGAIHIRADAVRKHLMSIPLDARGGPDAYDPRVTEKTYRRLVEIGLPLVVDGQTVILDATHLRKTHRDAAALAARAAGVPVEIIHCAAPEDVIRARLQTRPADVSDATVDLLASQAQVSEPFSDDERKILISLDTTHPPETNLRRFGFFSQR